MSLQGPMWSHSSGRGGKDHVGRQGQLALPLVGEGGPVPAAVVDKPLTGQNVQQVDGGGGGAPEHRVLDPVMEHGFFHIAGQLALPQAEEQGMLPLPIQNGREGADQQARPDPVGGPLPGTPFPAGRRLKIEDLEFFSRVMSCWVRAGTLLQGASERQTRCFTDAPPPPRGRRDPRRRRAVAELRCSTWRRRSTPSVRKSWSSMRPQAVSMWAVSRSRVSSPRSV